ncbi:30S ribosomal protein S16 [Candidatus Peribacteria bacterium]|nr:30S ribosomal protein S16 [Candidatus Peribacteria bacterium]
MDLLALMQPVGRLHQRSMRFAMLIIRLQRTGRENIPTYRIAVAEKSNPVKGGVHEYLGHYLPAAQPPVVEVNVERVQYWVSKGAMASDTAARLLSKNGVKGLDRYITRYAKRKSKNAEEVAPATPAPAAATPPPAEAPQA